MNFTRAFLTALVIAIFAGPASADRVRFATFNASMNRDAEGELAAALGDSADPQIAKVAEIIRAVDPDVILVNEFDYGAGHDRAFVDNYLGGDWPFSFIAPSNTGLATRHDLDGDGDGDGDGAAAAATAQGGANTAHRGDPRRDTADFDDEAPGNLRVDYVLPSAGLEVVAAGVYWPEDGDPGARLIDASDHRLVWIDVAFPTP